MAIMLFKNSQALGSSGNPNSRDDGYTAPEISYTAPRISHPAPKTSHTAPKISYSAPKIPRSQFDQPWAATKDEVSGQKKGFIPYNLAQEMSRSVRHAQVKWKPDEGPFDAVWLRDCCPCDRCVDPSTTQKTFDTADISPAIHPKSVDIHDDGSVHVSWKPDLPGFEYHVSVYDPSFGGKNHSLLSRLKATSNHPSEPNFWNRPTMSQHQLSVDYDSYMHSSSALLSCLQHLHIWGLLFIHSIPSSSDAVTRLAERIGPLKNTFYGSTWDVKSVPSAKNVAYTSSDLGFHMDLLYVENPPGLQILHCLESSTRGGESLFSDALRAIHAIAKRRPEHYSILEKFPVTYKYRNNAPFLVNTGSGIPFQDSVYQPDSQDDDIAAFRTYFEAIRAFKIELESDQAVFEKKLEPGTAVIFNNRRIVHARRAFTNQGGERWLRGAYVDTDVFRSRLRVLEEEESDQSQSKASNERTV
ncbi:MAG: hypothetical protein Q9226_001259 [Calogaya cf. arnoldii]